MAEYLRAHTYAFPTVAERTRVRMRAKAAARLENQEKSISSLIGHVPRPSCNAGTRDIVLPEPSTAGGVRTAARHTASADVRAW